MKIISVDIFKIKFPALLFQLIILKIRLEDNTYLSEIMLFESKRKKFEHA